MKTRKLFNLLSLLALASMLLAACGSAATEAPAPATEPPATEMPATEMPATEAPATEAPADPMAALYEAAKAEGMLTTIALPLDWCNYGAMYEGFKAKYPGIEINPLDPGAGSAEELEAIKANKDNPGPQAPDVVDIGIGRAPGAVEEGLLQAYKVATWDDIPDGAKDADGYWYGDYYGVLSFEVNTSVVANAPTEYADLLKPEYNGQVALSGDPLTSNAAALTVWAAGLSTGATGPEAAQAGLEFFKALNEAGNYVPIDGDSRTVGIGETPILIDWSYNSIANDIALAGNPDLETKVPTKGIIAGVYVQGISAYAPHPNAAKLWMEYLYSDEGQLTYASGFCYPIRLDAMNAAGSIPDEVFAQLPSIEDAYFPTVADIQAATKIVVEGWPTTVGVEVKEIP
jgi:putative spermidine/putrescine transport system substrate-binding protein